MPWPPVDAIGREELHKLTWLTFIQAVPGLAAQFKNQVPDDFVTTAAYDGENVIVEVACPCGETPTLAVASSEECKCGRFFLNTGTRVLVANSPVASPA